MRSLHWGDEVRLQCHGFLDAFLGTGLTIMPISAESAMAYWRAWAESTFIPTVILRALLQNTSTSRGAEVQRHKAQWKHTDGLLRCFPGAAALKLFAGTFTLHCFLHFLAERGAADATRPSRRSGRRRVSGAEPATAVLLLALYRNGHRWSHSPLISLKAFDEFAISVHLLSFFRQRWGSFCYFWVLLAFLKPAWATLKRC